MTEIRETIQEVLGSTPGHVFCESIPLCVGHLREWADRLERRQELIEASLSEFEGLLKYTEQLSVELEKSKPNTEVHVKVSEALKESFSSMSKKMKALKAMYVVASDELSPPEQLEHSLLSVEDYRSSAVDFSEYYRKLFRSWNFSDSEKKTSKAKKSEQDKGRSKSPRRSAARS